MSEPKPTIVEALSAVMDDVQAIRKSEKNSAPNANYMFRGIDAVMNAVGPAFRKHGVLCIPINVSSTYRDVLTSTGKPSREVTVNVTYRFIGPAGDHLDSQIIGEAMDSGDKGSAKAMSVAYRTLLLQALTIPTDEPDPDSVTHERAYIPRQADRTETAPRPPADPGEALKPATRGRMFALLTERGITERDDQIRGISAVIGRRIESRSDLTDAEGLAVCASLNLKGPAK